MFAYCLFCQTEKSESICKAAISSFQCRAVSPRQIQHTWSKGKMIDIERDLLPGYIFLYFDDEYPDVSNFRKLHGVIRCLSDSSCRYTLTGSDEQFALTLLQLGGRIGKTKVYREGDLIRISEGVFSGLEANILKVDRRASRMQVEIPFAGRSVKTWLEYEIVEKAPGSSETDALPEMAENK